MSSTNRQISETGPGGTSESTSPTTWRSESERERFEFVNAGFRNSLVTCPPRRERGAFRLLRVAHRHEVHSDLVWRGTISLQSTQRKEMHT
jgi:hypothetical protein